MTRDVRPAATSGTSATYAFTALGLTPGLARAAAEQGWLEPTPVQAEAMPPALQRRDVLARAPTGSGKTAAYALPLMNRLDVAVRPGGLRQERRTTALVLVPTRELAQQVGATLRELARWLEEPARVALLFGGVSINPQLMGLRGGAEVVVATPGRLLDVLDHNGLRLDNVGLVVLDEADRLLDEGFADEWQRIAGLLPPHRQHLLFSATFTPGVLALAEGLLRDPVRVDVTAALEAALPAITQRAIEVDAPRRLMLLRHLLASERWPRVLAFVATRHASEQMADKLQRAGIAAAPFHGEMSQGARSDVLADLRAGRLQVVLATDMAARGLHIADLPVVVNIDLPRSPDDYTHRIGRTARAGAAGVAVSFVSAATEAHFRLIEKRQGQRVPRERIAGFEPTEAAPAPSVHDPEGTGGIKGRRKSKKDKLREAAAAEAAAKKKPGA